MLVKNLGRGLLCLTLFWALTACKEQVDLIRANPDPKFKYDKAFEFYANKDWLKAQALLEDLIPIYRLDPKGEDVGFAYAYTHYHQKNYQMAAYYFMRFSTNFPNSLKVEEAQYMCARSYFELSPNFRLSQEDTEKAIEQFQLFVNSFPESKHVQECNDRIDKLRSKLEAKAIDNANGYFRRRQYRSAMHSYKQILEEYAGTAQDEYLRYMIFRSAFLYAEKSILSKQAERYEAATEYYRQYRRKYPVGGASAQGKKAPHAKDVERLYYVTQQNLKSLRHE